MFDRTYIAFPQQTVSHHTTSHVVEQRAPTDESIRLLNEMQDKARENVIRALPLEGNSFKGQVMEDVTMGGRGAVAVFEINGKRCTAKVEDSYSVEPFALLQELHAEIAKVIAAEVLDDMLGNLPKYTRIFR